MWEPGKEESATDTTPGSPGCCRRHASTRTAGPRVLRPEGLPGSNAARAAPGSGQGPGQGPGPCVMCGRGRSGETGSSPPAFRGSRHAGLHILADPSSIQAALTPAGGPDADSCGHVHPELAHVRHRTWRWGEGAEPGGPQVPQVRVQHPRPGPCTLPAGVSSPGRP